MQIRPSSVRLFIFAALLIVGRPGSAAVQEEFGTAKGSEVPQPHAASDAGDRALAKMRLAPGLKASLWAAEPMLANPVALNFDNQGRCYLVETWRFEHGVIDIRSHMSWLDDDLACRTVEDRLQMVRRKMGPNARSFSKMPDVVRLIEDRAGTGKADTSTVFAQFHDMADGVAAGVVVRKGNVYLTDIPNLWLLQDTKHTGTADVRKSLSYGYGVRYNFLGHDLHGPRFGPDGKLYFSIGDRGANIERSVDGRHVESIETGCVFRCNADGSGLEIFARGLRNPQCLAFDDYGNLFTGDNNPDFGDPARWVYVVEQGDSGWRVGYQYAHHPINGGPWMWEKLWATQDKSTAGYLIPPVEDYGAGPSGVAYYPGTGLSHAYDNHFFECDFRGGFTGSGVHSFMMKPKGAGFEMVKDKAEFVWDTLATDIVFAPQGGAYITDWVEGWKVSGVGRIYKIVDPEAMKDPIVAEVKKLLAEGFEKRSPEELIGLLAHRDQRVRQEAQFELADRGASEISVLEPCAKKNDSRLARVHAIWALGQIADKSPQALAGVIPLLADGDDEIRAQAARVLGDHHEAGAFDGLIRQLKDASPRVRYFAAMGLGKLKRKDAANAILEMIRENADQDAYLRHAGVTALVAIDDADTLNAAAKDSSPSVRLACLLAWRRQAKPEVTAFLHDSEPQLVLEAARAINDLPIAPALPQLAAMIDNPSLPDFVMARVVNANFRLGTAESAAALAKFAANSSAKEQWRVEALNCLAEWKTPGLRDRLTDLHRPLPERDPAIASHAAGPIFGSILHDAPNKVRVAALAAIQKLGVTDCGVLLQLLSDRKLSADVRVGAINALAAQNDSALPQAVDVAMADPTVSLRAAGITAMGKLPGAGPRLVPLLEKGSVTEQQAALAAFGQMPGEFADQTIAAWMDKLLGHTVPATLQLDVLEAAEKRQGVAAIHDRLEKFKASLPAADPLAEYRVALEGGDSSAGDKIFHERADASCLRCHTVHGKGGIVGPVLDGVGTRQNREYLLESIVLPNAKIAPGFESVIVRLKDETTLTGVVKKDTPQLLQLIDAEGHTLNIKPGDIESRHRGQSAMPEGFGKILTKRDLRDLVEYLASLKR
jgi:quinoprotein glucose dehydrogenase